MRRLWSTQSPGRFVPNGVPPLASSQVAQEERDDNGQYVYRPSFTDPPVDESELDEDGFTAQDRVCERAARRVCV